MKRGDIVIAAERGRLTGKPRPWLVVQSDAFNPHHRTISVAMITSETEGLGLFRIGVARDDANGLRETSSIHVDKIASISRTSIVQTVGQLDAVTMDAVDDALRRWFDL